MVLGVRKIPTLVELCIRTAIDNVKYLGDVGETDIHLLKDILPHCTLDQLMQIEDSTKAKVKERDEAQKKSVDRLKKLYEAEGARKQSRQIQICSKVPPSSKKRFFSGGEAGASSSNVKGSLMKKAKMEYLNSHEVKVHLAMKKQKLQGKSFSSSSSSVSRTMKPSSCLGKSPASKSKVSKPFGR